MAASSLEEARQMLRAGTLRKRAGNAFERQAREEWAAANAQMGRPVNTLSKSRQAAALAVYLMQSEGLGITAASAHAAKAWGLDQRGVMRYVKRTAPAHMTTLVQGSATRVMGVFVPGQEHHVPFVVAVEEADGAASAASPD